MHLDTLDTIAHAYGPYSYEYEAELSTIVYVLNRELVEKIDPETASETLILVTADHGTVNVDPHETFYLNYIPSVLGNLKYGENGKRILPVGSPRDVFLHVREEKTGKREIYSQACWLKRQK
ncbi:MAG: alkaline phosphatase family protein [Candidatus Bathyarchaeales archaeon]